MKTTISIEKETFTSLLKRKMEFSAEQGSPLTWSKFLEKLLERSK